VYASSLIKFSRDAVKQTHTVTQNEIGEDVQTWVDGDTIKALVLPLAGKFSRDLPGVTDTSTHMCFTLSNLTSNERLVQNSTTYLIQHVEDWISHKQAVLELVT
jgi:hypothetical protein